MARYYFHVHDGEIISDEQGTELPDLQAARDMSLQFAGDLLKEQGPRFWNGQDWKLDCVDANGLTLFTLTFSAMDAPAISL